MADVLEGDRGASQRRAPRCFWRRCLENHSAPPGICSLLSPCVLESLLSIIRALAKAVGGRHRDILIILQHSPRNADGGVFHEPRPPVKTAEKRNVFPGPGMQTAGCVSKVRSWHGNGEDRLAWDSRAGALTLKLERRCLNSDESCGLHANRSGRTERLALSGSADTN